MHRLNISLRSINFDYDVTLFLLVQQWRNKNGVHDGASLDITFFLSKRIFTYNTRILLWDLRYGRTMEAATARDAIIN